MQQGQSSFAADTTRASVTTPYFAPFGSGGGIPAGNVDIQGNLSVTGNVVADGTLTVGDTTSVINLVGSGNVIGAGPENIIIASDAVINLTPGVGESVVVDGDLNCTGIVTSRAGDASATSLVASGVATILNGTTITSVAFPGLQSTGRALATIAGPINDAGGLSVEPFPDELIISSQDVVTADTNVFWMIIALS
jgi:predicted acyltransferase (DUF342 family)